MSAVQRLAEKTTPGLFLSEGTSVKQ